MYQKLFFMSGPAKKKMKIQTCNIRQWKIFLIPLYGPKVLRTIIAGDEFEVISAAFAID